MNTGTIRIVYMILNPTDVGQYTLFYFESRVILLTGGIL